MENHQENRFLENESVEKMQIDAPPMPPTAIPEVRSPLINPAVESGVNSTDPIDLNMNLPVDPSSVEAELDDENMKDVDPVNSGDHVLMKGNVDENVKHPVSPGAGSGHNNADDDENVKHPVNLNSTEKEVMNDAENMMINHSSVNPGAAGSAVGGNTENMINHSVNLGVAESGGNAAENMKQYATVDPEADSKKSNNNIMWLPNVGSRSNGQDPKGKAPMVDDENDDNELKFIENITEVLHPDEVKFLLFQGYENEHISHNFIGKIGPPQVNTENNNRNPQMVDTKVSCLYCHQNLIYDVGAFERRACGHFFHIRCFRAQPAALQEWHNRNVACNFCVLP